jgi:8-oxo-dGTP pyrophosphatase MutT (NUDIX family)
VDPDSRRYFTCASWMCGESTIVVEWLQRRAFWLYCKIAYTTYGWFPIFGPLRGSVALIRSGDQLLVIERHGDLGLSLPGGLARPWESNEAALSREVFEETGLRVVPKSLFLRYTSELPFPCLVSVFEAEGIGEIRKSWEGTPRWRNLETIQQRITVSQRVVIDRLRNGPAGHPDGG